MQKKASPASQATVTRHVARASSEYKAALPLYEDFAKVVERLVREKCGKGLLHKIESRSKDLVSFERKAGKTDDDGLLVYQSPIKDITDLAGVRAIVFTRDRLDEVCEHIRAALQVNEFQDVGDREFKKGRPFGYQSRHFLVSLPQQRLELFDFERFGGLTCEVQVRTVLQHAWAEMEHDIQYKSEIEIPDDLGKRFTALAGLLEIADREFENIQKESDALKARVKQDLISDLTQERLTELKSDTGDSSSPIEGLTTRDLVSSGRYQEATEAYSLKINMEPHAFTLYIGRARALFLAGDRLRALQDLDRADVISGDPSHTARLRSIIEKGDDPREALAPIKKEGQIADGLKAAAEALSKGDGVRAFEEYSNLESLSYNRALTLFGKAICCCLERDISGSLNYLSSLKMFPATVMAVNIAALRAIVSILSGDELTETMKVLSSQLENCPEFTLSASPLNAFLNGLKKKDYPEKDLVQRVEDCLKQQML